MTKIGSFKEGPDITIIGAAAASDIPYSTFTPSPGVGSAFGMPHCIGLSKDQGKKWGQHMPRPMDGQAEENNNLSGPISLFPSVNMPGMERDNEELYLVRSE